jgi:hypothetical protein
LEEVGERARLCLALDSRALAREGDAFVLRNGPYMRKFLDGYYPMRVSMDVVYPQESLRFADIQPTPTQGMRVDAETGRVSVDAWFEGRLTTQLRFVPAEQ